MKHRVFALLLSVMAAVWVAPIGYSQELTSAQELCLIMVSKVEVPEIQYVPVEPPKYWTNGIMTQLGFSQVSLTNWAEGGSGSISMNAYVEGNANYRRGSMMWENRFRMAYGFIQSFGDPYKKGDDRLQLESKWGYKAIDNLYFSAIFNFKTQLTPGFNNSVTDRKMLSDFMSPGYLTLGLGIDYQPFKSLSINFAPLTGSLVVVNAPSLRTKYGNKEDEKIRKEFGAQLKTTFKKDFKNVKVNTSLTLFSDFLNKPQNIQVHWDFDATFKIFKYISTVIRTNLIYDHNILIADKNGENPTQRIQFKEGLSLTFVYTIGKYEKAK